MALETATHNNQLVAANPTATDPKSQGDDHLRLVKSVLLTDFPNVGGIVTATHTELNLLSGQTGAISFPANTRISFAQASAPTGWVQVTDDSANNRMLRVVDAVGAGIGGTQSPILNNTVPSHTHGFTTGFPSVDHTHNIIDGGHSHISGVPFDNNVYGTSGISSTNGKTGVQAYSTSPITSTAFTGIYNSGATISHTHSGSTDAGSSQTNWAPRYIDMIICRKS